MRQTTTGGHDEPTRYEIRVKGHLEPRWAAWLDGSTLSRQPDGTTVIEGLVADQAALHGLLQTLRDVGVPLISVTDVDREQFVAGDPTNSSIHDSGA